MIDNQISFVLASSDHGTLIVNRNDYNFNAGSPNGYGVGFDILSKSHFFMKEIEFIKTLLTHRRDTTGDGLITIDGGANIGIHTIEWAKHMRGWGEVIAFEAQEPVFYALAGNIVINNCHNAKAKLMALSDVSGDIDVPVVDYTRPASFGSLELMAPAYSEDIGQPISYENTYKIPSTSIDSLYLSRLDFFKLDVEGMEVPVLKGAIKTIKKYTPILFVEYLKTEQSELLSLLQSLDYHIFTVGINVLAIHIDDPILDIIKDMWENTKTDTDRLLLTEIPLNR